MRVEDVMSGSIVTLTSEETLRDALNVLRSNRVRHLPLVDDSKVVGIVTNRDVKHTTPSILSGVRHDGYDMVLATTKVAQFMTRDLAYWALGAPPGGTGRFGRELMLSITWAVYATGLIVAGIRQRYAPIRYTGIVVFGLTILKMFAVDLAELDQIYRVSSVLGLGVLLLLTSYLYHRFRQALE